MNKKRKFFSCLIALILALTILCPSAFAREFAPVIDATNIGVQTQYKYEENNPSWLRQMVIKEDMLSSSGLINEVVMHPISDYPYTTDAPHFKAQVEEYIELYTLDEDSQKAAYLYLLEQFGALSIIANPETSDKSKADWLREQGIIITEEDEKDSEKALMINALYALMYNDFYYVIKGERLTIPNGTPLEEATVMYLMALSGNNQELTDFVLKYFHKDKIVTLDDYAYYTSLVALYSQGYVSPTEIPTLPRKEVYRRVAIMTIHTYGIAVDAETATTEEINHKYLSAMLGTQYSITVDPASLKKAMEGSSAAYYILQRMAYEDSKVTISQTKHTYAECFDIVLKKTDRFDLDDEFFSDIYEYDIHLEHARKTISINPVPISKTGTSIQINGVKTSGNSYALVNLSGKEKETITIVSSQKTGKKTKTSIYKVNVHQGKSEAPDSDLTGLFPTLGKPTTEATTVPATQQSTGASTPHLTLGVSGVIDNALNGAGNVLETAINTVLSLNEKGQLIDQHGNIISDSTYETLPEGYKYAMDNDGVITIIPEDKKTTEAPTESTAPDTEAENSTRKIIIIVSLVAFIILLIALIVVVIITKNNKKPTNSQKARKPKNKEKRKIEKNENKP